MNKLFHNKIPEGNLRFPSGILHGKVFVFADLWMIVRMVCYEKM